MYFSVNIKGNIKKKWKTKISSYMTNFEHTFKLGDTYM
jgi:hypothetical protein